MSRIFINGREVEVPMDDDGNVNVEDMRRAANIPPGRAIIRQMPTGENVVVRRRGRTRLNPYYHLIDAPISRRG